MTSMITSAGALVLVILGVVCVILVLLSGGRRGDTEPRPMASTSRAIFGLFGVLVAALGIGLFWTFTPNLPGHPPTPTTVLPTPTQVAVVPSQTPTQMPTATPTYTPPSPTVVLPTSTPVSPTSTTTLSPTPTTAPSPTPTTTLPPTPTTTPSPTPSPPPSPTPTPPPCTIIHVVEAGETLSGIAASYGTTVEAIVQANNIASPSLIYVGQQLVISVCGTATPSPSPLGPTPTATPKPIATPTSPCMYPSAEITSPHEGDRLKKGEKVIVWGTATHIDFQFYEIEYISPDGALISVEGSHYYQVTDGQLAVWDTTQLSEGMYTLRIKVVDTTGNFLPCDVRVFIE